MQSGPIAVVEIPYVVSYGYSELGRFHTHHVIGRVRDQMNRFINGIEEDNDVDTVDRRVLVELVPLDQLLPDMHVVQPENAAKAAEKSAGQPFEFLNDLQLFADIGKTNRGWSKSTRPMTSRRRLSFSSTDSTAPSSTSSAVSSAPSATPWTSDELLARLHSRLAMRMSPAMRQLFASAEEPIAPPRQVCQVSTLPLLVFLVIHDRSSPVIQECKYVFPYAKIVFIRPFLSNFTAPDRIPPQLDARVASMVHTLSDFRDPPVPITAAAAEDYMDYLKADAAAMCPNPFKMTPAAAMSNETRQMVQEELEFDAMSRQDRHDFVRQDATAADDTLAYPKIVATHDDRARELGARSVEMLTLNSDLVDCLVNRESIRNIVAWADEYSTLGDAYRTEAVYDQNVARDVADLIAQFAKPTFENEL